MAETTNGFDYSAVTPDIKELADKAYQSTLIDSELYKKWDVKRGLRDLKGKGVLAGLTHISDVHAVDIINGESVPVDGTLRYRGYDVKDLVRGISSRNDFGFEEITYLLLFDKLPNRKELDDFRKILARYRALPKNFVRDVIMKAPSSNMMNTLARSVLTLYSYDSAAEDISIPNVLRQSLQLISLFPMLSVYSYQAYAHYQKNESLYIHMPDTSISLAENLLYILRPDSSYTELEAKVLDIAMVLHADHGGGNNSTFTTHVVTSTGTDTYSSVAASLGSLKGPRHGGANVKVVEMFATMKEEIKDWTDEEEVSRYLADILDKKAFDKKGLIYGVGHAVYSLSDPREIIFKSFVERLAHEKGLDKEFALYDTVERLAPKEIAKRRPIYKGVCANVDFYSGFVYQMLDLPPELYTPIFACARISGWSAHRIEELSNNGKIIRPAFKSAQPIRDYIRMDERE
ncbi:MAG: citrate/2-methylcitrate synthase [Lachnospiraceae bacterium]|nr:citrate/2-methylcitrate synthase [Lachnospiraceae bacterium]MBR1523859.1 citrate/2-methylcitrate synthase [Lachnospiraceae bacterium]